MFETTLLFKTLTILSTQIAIVFGGTYLFITYARKVAKNGKSFFGYHFRQARNIYNQKLDLVPYPVAQTHFPRFMARKEPVEVVENTLLGPKTKIEHEIIEKFVRNEEERKSALREGYKDQGITNPFLVGMFILWAILLFTLPYIQMAGGMLIGMLAFTLLSLLFVPTLGTLMLEGDDNDGILAMRLTMLITFFTAVIGLYSGIDFANNVALNSFLFFSLIGLILFEISRSFINISRPKVRGVAFFGIFIFIGFLLVDFNYIVKYSNSGNTWDNAFQIAFQLYLDMINLLLEILEAMGD
ncbi:MAG: Bax inhibitor-1 family protein [Gammaproteobacteria bacterium]